MFFRQLQALTIFIISGIFLFASQSEAQLAGLYTKASKALYEVIEGKSCADFSHSDIQQLKSRGVSFDCLPGKNPLKHFSLNANEMMESLFFQMAAEREVTQLECGIQRISQAHSSSELRTAIRNDLLKKLPIASEIRKEMLRTEHELGRLRVRSNSLRPSGLDNRATTPEYEASFRQVQELEAKRKSQDTAFEALMSSMWMGGTQASREHLKKFIQKGFSGNDQDIEAFDKSFPKYIDSIKNELQKNKKAFLKQSERTPEGKILFNRLDLKTKQALVKHSMNSDLFSKMSEDSEQMASKLQCRLEGKYGKGTEYLDNTLFAGSLLATGGGALLARAPLALRASVASGFQSHRISLQASQVLLAAGATVATGQMLQEVDRQCLANDLRSRPQANICEMKGDHQIYAEMISLSEGNCALSVLLSGLPIPVAARASKQISQLKTQDRAQALFETAPLSSAVSSSPKKSKLQLTVTEEEWRKTRSLSGSDPIPAGMDLEFSLIENGMKKRVVTQTARISDLPRPTRSLVQGLKIKSKALTPDEHERMALVVEYSDGTSKAVKLTSRQFGQVRSIDQDKAFDGSGISYSDKVITKVTHVHTHPDFRNPLAEGGRTDYIGPSLGDFHAYEAMRDSIRQSNPNAKFEAIVAPSCAHCDDLIFRVGDTELDRMAKNR